MSPVIVRTGRRRLPFWMRRGLGQGQRYGNLPCYYHDGRLHPICVEQVAPHCDLCRYKRHERCRTKNERLHCLSCVERERQAEYWYDSKDEARTAERLDGMLAHGEILWWRKAKAVVLQPAIPGQRAITYRPDFVVEWRKRFEGDTIGQETWEVKGSQYVIADDALLKIKMYRAMARIHGWPPLRVLDGRGQPIHA